MIWRGERGEKMENETIEIKLNEMMVLLRGDVIYRESEK